MSLLRSIADGLRTLFRMEQVNKELDEELNGFMEMAAEKKMKQGMSRKDALRAVRLERGNLEVTKEVVRSAGWESFLETLWQDLRFATRTMGKNPGFTAAAVLAIALGVGINVGIFSVLNGAALRLLPIPRAEEVVSIDQIFRGRVTRNSHNGPSMFSYSEYLDFRDHNHVFSGLLAYEPFVEATLGGDKMRGLTGALSTCNYFDVLEEHPVQGRGFLESDCATPGGNAVVVISDDLWRGTFASDPSLVGKGIILNRTAYIVVGIAPPGFKGTEPIPSSFWVPITMQKALDPWSDRMADGNLSWLALLGRVQRGVTMEQVRANLAVIAGRIDQLHPGRTTSLAIRTATFFNRQMEREILTPIVSVILAAFGLVLLVACANVANLLLARASVRRKEIALRLSIGASRWRLVRQLLTECLLLSLIGGALGSLLAFWSFTSITRLIISHLPHEASTLIVNVAPDFHVLAYALGLTVFTGIAFGLIPALQSSRQDLNTALKEDGIQRGGGKEGGRFLRSALVGTQVAVCTILLLATGLLLRGLYYAQTVDPGFEMKGVATMFLNLGQQGYTERQGTAFMASLQQRISGLPGVVGVAHAECAPLSHDFSADAFTFSGRVEKIGIEYNHVSPEYFSVVGIPIVRGRGFLPGETHDSPGVVVTESTARRLWPDEDALGKTLRESGGREYSVIGVARDAQVAHLGDAHTMYLYFPAGTQDNLRAYVLVRYAGDFPATAKAIRDVVQSLDADAPADVTKLEDYLEVWRMPSRIVAALSGALGLLALLLASIGVYGVVSYSVSRRVHEIGVRMALGAEGREIMNLVLRQAMRPVLFGGLVGVAGCAAVSQALSGMLFGLSAHDPVAFISVPLFLLAVALIASYVPARGALRVDPMVALRYE
jgi:macrolide transport system ATP-binding/permease protein